MADFSHPAVALTEDKPLVYPAMSRRLFYFRMHISAFVLRQHKVPLNPFMVFDYFMADLVDRDVVREANNNMVKRSDELWVFGEVSNGVLAEVKVAKEMKKPIRYFTIDSAHQISEIAEADVVMEAGMEAFKSEL